MSTSISSLLLTLIVAMVVAAVPARGQCPGDCDGNGAVAVNELVTGVNIALEQAAVDTCPEFDTDNSDSVTVNELIAGVNNALTECPATPTIGASTPTPTPTATLGSPTTTPTVGSPTATPTITLTPAPGACGNNVVDFEQGETCDDGNQEEGPDDDCPANCRIATCTAGESTVDVDVSFATPSTDLAAVQVFVRYPEDIIRIPGRGQAPSVLDRFSNIVELASYSFNDKDYSLLVLAFTSGEIIPAGRLFTVSFDLCQGATAPDPSAFTCTVTDVSPDTAEGVTCAVSVP